MIPKTSLHFVEDSLYKQINLEMDVLQQEEDQFKFKLYNVFFQYFKYSLLIIMTGYEGIQMLRVSNTCSFGEVSYISTLYNGGIALLLFNIISAGYILYQKHFVRIEYFITYGLNLLWFTSMIFFSIIQYFRRTCELGELTIKYFVLQSIICQIDVLLIMIFKHEISNRQVNICSNTAIVVLTLTKPFNMDCALNVISIEIMLIAANIITMLFFTGLNIAIYILPKLKQQLTNAFKFVCVLVLCFLILNYLLIVYFVQSGDILENQNCISIDFITRTYCFIAPITMLGMIPIFASFKFQTIDDDEEETGLEFAVPQTNRGANVSQPGFQQSRLALSPYTPYKIVLNQNMPSSVQQYSQDEQFFFKKS